MTTSTEVLRSDEPPQAWAGKLWVIIWHSRRMLASSHSQQASALSKWPKQIVSLQALILSCSYSAPRYVQLCAPSYCSTSYLHYSLAGPFPPPVERTMQPPRSSRDISVDTFRHYLCSPAIYCYVPRSYRTSDLPELFPKLYCSLALLSERIHWSIESILGRFT